MAVSRLSQQSIVSAFPKGTSMWDGTTSVGSMDAISAATVSTGGLGVVEFNNIPQTYTHLQLRVLVRGNRTPVTYDNFSIRFNNDTGSNYSYHTMYGDGRSNAVNTEGGASQSAINVANIPGSASLANSFGVAIVDVLDYTNTNKTKSLRSLNGYESNTTGWGSIYSSIAFMSGGWYSTSAINAITIIPSNAPFQEFSSFILYGVK